MKRHRSVAAWALVAAASTWAVVALAALRSPRNAHFATPVEVVAVPDGAAAIERGRHLAEAVAVCTVCHGDDLGGKLAFDHPLLGRGRTPNLTGGRGGIGADYRVEDWVRALRHGVDRGGRGLLFMPTDHYRHLSDADLGALIAYLRSLPPVDDASAGLALTPLARAMIDLGLSGAVVRAATVDHFAPRPPAHAGPGAYLVEIGGCTFCHGADLQGGRGLEPGAPPAPALGAGSGLAARPFDAFVACMRGGTNLAGRPIDPRYMPWQGYRRMTDAELQAIWRFTTQLPPRARTARTARTAPTPLAGSADSAPWS